MNEAAVELKRFGFPLLAVAAALVPGLFFQPDFTIESFALLFGAVAVCAWRGGLGPGLAATLFSLLTSNFLFVSPRLTFEVDEPKDMVHLCAFGIAACLLSMLTDRFRNERLRVHHMLLENARLYEQAQLSLRDREEAIRRHCEVEEGLTLLVEGSGALISALEPDRVLPQILALADRLIDADAYAVWRLDPEAGEWRIVCDSGLSQDFSRTAVPADPDRPGFDTPHIIDDVETAPARREAYHSEGIRSILSLPLRIRGETTGSIAFYSRKPHQFSATEVRVGTALANLAAAAIGTAELYRELDDAGRRKDHFLAMLAHELRNPLAPVRTALHLLSVRPDDRETVERVREVGERQIRHLTRLTDDLLDVSRISRGKMVLKRERLDLTQLIRSTVEDMRSTLTADRASLSESTPDTAVWVDGDPVRLAQVIGNLIHNAVKFTPAEGRITVSLETDRGTGEATQGFALIRVRDTGAGISADLLERIFDPFTQAEQTLDRSTGGLGLGLALVRGLTELHGGTVEVRSDGSGAGSEFLVRLPLAVRSAPELTAFSPVPPPHTQPLSSEAGGSTPPSRHVLIIEDNRDAAETLQEVLELYGYAVDLAMTGPEGLDAARRLHPDIVLCDIGLPGMDGYAVARGIRGEPEEDVDVVTAHPGPETCRTAPATLIALSGYGQQEDIRRALRAGFDAHLTKPIDVETLLPLLSGGPDGPERTSADD